MSKKIKSILLVDDDIDDLLLFQEALSEVDGTVRCVTAGNGIDALEKLHTSAIFPDLIIMDVNMPMMNGSECLKALKDSEKFRYIPVIMYSTSYLPDFQKECFENGASGYMKKPSDFVLLCSQIENTLNSGFNAISKKPIK